MYSVVLMATLTAGHATPDWHHCGGRYGSHCGCGGGYYGGYDDGYSCYGCWGGYSSWSYGCSSYPSTTVMGGYGLMNGGVVPGTGNGSEEPRKPKSNKNGDKETMAPTRAQLIVELPANARLFIDDMPVKVRAGVHTFNTPVLESGQAYFYMVRIESIRDGKPVSQTRRLIVQAGQVARIDFKEPESEVASARR